MYDVV